MVLPAGGCLPGPRGGWGGGGCLPGPGGFSLPVGGVCLVPGGSLCQRGICLVLGGFYLPGGGLPGDPPVNRIIHTCKNITLATTSLRPVISGLPYVLAAKRSTGVAPDVNQRIAQVAKHESEGLYWVV